MNLDSKEKRIAAGALAGVALGVFMLPKQGFDFSRSEDVSRAVGFFLGFIAFGAFIGWISGPKDEEDD